MIFDLLFNNKNKKIKDMRTILAIALAGIAFQAVNADDEVICSWDFDLPDDIDRNGECWNMYALFGWFDYEACHDIWTKWEEFCDCYENDDYCVQLWADVDNNVNNFW